MANRYLIFRHWPWYTVHAGTGTQVLFKSLRWKPAARIAAALETAFADGKYVEYMQGSKYAAETLAPIPEPKPRCICKPPESGPNWGVMHTADWRCPVHGGLMQNVCSTNDAGDDDA